MKTRKICSWILVVMWMGLIFFMSAQVADQSNEISTGITDRIITGIEKLVPTIRIDRYSMNHLIRKSAHFYTYMVLGLLVCNALMLGKNKKLKTYLTALIICVLYAISDEVHQLFVEGRGGQIKDVLLDSIGSLTGLGLYAVLVRLIRLSRKKRKS
ncbi:MAG TPA: VanZ family protein [Clostridiales bacterium]|nr:VanZ family protein [Clostridiales bacterium]